MQVIYEATVSFGEITSDIKFLTKRALMLKERIEVGWYDIYLGYTLTFYDKNPEKWGNDLIPNSSEAWLVVSPMTPSI